MRLTSHADYALRILLFLAIHRGRLVATEAIARRYGSSWNHLTKIVQRLGQLGYVEVRRGRGGGLQLGREPAEINVGAVVRDFEPNLAVVDLHCRGICDFGQHREALFVTADGFITVIGYAVGDRVERAQVHVDGGIGAQVLVIQRQPHDLEVGAHV